MNGYIEIAYFFASLSFVIGLKMLSHPDSARKGNMVAAVGMGLAILLTMMGEKIHNYGWIIGALIIGTGLGAVSARKVKMTAMPQMVSLFNGMGGACAAVISLVEFQHNETLSNHGLNNSTTAIILVGMLIGSVSFSGSMIAFGKLQGYKAIEKPVTYPLQKILNTILMLITIGIGVFIVLNGGTPKEASQLFYGMFALSILYGILFVLPIGGADMPVVISLLNSFTGVAAACAGFLYGNMVMLIGGILVGSAGTILTVVMCSAMNRSLMNVIFGSFGGGAAAGITSATGDQTVREISLTDSAILLSYAKKVIIVPGYGLAVAQAQHTCHELDELLEEKGVDVRYAIHPVAGRMPGHMNVLLAEADVPYPKLFDMEEINGEFSSTDVVLVIGANDVVNPAARKDPASPIYGMPILDVDNAANIIVLKRGMNAGYAGIENELFFDPKTKMLFGDAKSSLVKLVAEVKQN
ncbi:MAG: NAD(P)(+) transhydrogenase (Re/Si-specific) subunit beta [Leptospiraceae bacterium]|nr:NAD(P)(+) transhydrogenase (Re/Si-specific) subunit beta [Leptospiraceae bacterium]